MEIKYHQRFLKHYKKRIYPYKHSDQKFTERVALFFRDPTNSVLKDHALGGQLKSFRSFSIGGDIRIIYRISMNVIEFYDIGSHNQVY